MGIFDDDDLDYVEDLSGLDPEFVASLEGLRQRSRRNLIELERESLLAIGRRRMSREVGYSWADLARVAGVSRQALRQRFGDRAEGAEAGGTAQPRLPRPR